MLRVCGSNKVSLLELCTKLCSKVLLELKSRIKALDLENPKMVLEYGMCRPEPGIFCEKYVV